MDLTDYMKALRRRWRVIAAAVVVGLAAGALTTYIGPGSSDEKQYEAGAAILSTNRERTNLFTVAALTELGEVPERVAETIDYQGDPTVLGERLTTDVFGEMGVMWIRTTARSPDRAALIANTFAHEVIEFMTEGRVESSRADASRLRRQMKRTRGRVESLEGQIGGAGSSTRAAILTAERDAALRSYEFLAAQYQQAIGTALDPAPIQILSEAKAGPALSTGPLDITLPSRLVLAGILGLLAGTALALVLERFDTRIRSKKSAETHFSLPVLAEIPVTPRRVRGGSVVAAAKPKSPFADAFRLLATGLSGRISGDGSRGSGSALGRVGPVRSPQTILVTSPAPGEGKTTVTANLAASFAEQGKRVLVLSCDFRSPSIHQMFDVPNDKGLAEALTSGNADGFLVNGHVKNTSIRRISVVPSSAEADNPGGLLSSDSMEDVLLEAREKADVVLLDTAPILTGAESAVLFPKVDAVLVVARVGTTTIELAERTSDLMSRLGTPVVGVALNASTDVGVSRRDYRDSSQPPENAPPSTRRKDLRRASKAGPSSQAGSAAPDITRGRPKSTATVPSGAAPSNARTAQPPDRGKAKQSGSSEPRPSADGPATADEPQGMKKWEL